MKTVFFTVCDENHKNWAENLERSFHHFHPDIEFKIYSGKYVKRALKQDPQFFYKQKPWIMRELIKEYDLVVGMDADSIVTGELTEVLEGNYEVGVVNNFNQKDYKDYGAVTVFNIDPRVYLNCGLVAATSEKFVNHWWRLCNSPLFNTFQYREQDILNLILTYGDYLMRNFDMDAFYGVSGKDLWRDAVIKDDQVVIEFADDKGKILLVRPVKVVHVAGGYNPNKMELDKIFNPEVVTHIKKLYEN